MASVRKGLIAVGLVAAFSAEARAQALAFTPIVGTIFDGATLNVTPVVTADRRYVRLSLMPVFSSVSGFDTFSVPGAVAGGPGGPGALGGLGGGGLGGGGLGGGLGGGGFRSVMGSGRDPLAKVLQQTQNAAKKRGPPGGLPKPIPAQPRRGVKLDP